MQLSLEWVVICYLFIGVLANSALDKNEYIL